MEKNADLILKRQSTLGEGALWDSRCQRLLWVDIMQNLVFIYDPAIGRNEQIDCGSPVGCVVPRKSGGLAVAVKDGFAAIDPITNKLTMLKTADNAGGRFNDGKCDPAGRFWAGTIAANAAPNAATLYCLDPDLTLRVMQTGITISNGIVWTSDHKMMYYIDSPTKEVWAYDYDPKTGQISNRRTAIRIPADLGYPDGMAIDSQNMLWIALWGSARCCRWNPVTGQILDTIHVPGTHQTSSCALGGKNLDELYITTAGENFTAEDYRKYPLSGSLFMARVETPGVPAGEFGG